MEILLWNQGDIYQMHTTLCALPFIVINLFNQGDLFDNSMNISGLYIIYLSGTSQMRNQGDLAGLFTVVFL